MIKNQFCIRTYWISECATIYSYSDALFKAYRVWFRVLMKRSYQKRRLSPEIVFSAQDLILMSDVVITDYSNIIFDAMAIDKTVALYTPNHSQYIESQGVNKEDIWRHLSKIGIQTDNY